MMRISKEEFVKRFGEPVNFPHDEWQIIEVTGEEIYEWVTDLGIVLVDEAELRRRINYCEEQIELTKKIKDSVTNADVVLASCHGELYALKRILGSREGGF